MFLNAMGAEYLSYVKSIATLAPTFYGYITSVLASVVYVWIDRRLQKDFQPTMYVQSLRIISFDAPAFAIKKMKPVSVKLVFLIRKSSYCFNYIHSLRKALPRGSIFFAFRIKHYY